MVSQQAVMLFVQNIAAQLVEPDHVQPNSPAIFPATFTGNSTRLLGSGQQTCRCTEVQGYSGIEVALQGC